MTCLNKKVWLLAGLVSIAGVVAGCDDDDSSNSDSSCKVASYGERCENGIHFFCSNGVEQLVSCTCDANGKTCASSTGGGGTGGSGEGGGTGGSGEGGGTGGGGTSGGTTGDETDLTCKNGAGATAAGTKYQDWTYTGCACDTTSYVKKCGVVDGKEVVFTCYKNDEEYKVCNKCSVNAETNYYECDGGSSSGGGGTADAANYNGQGSVNKVESSYSELGITEGSTKNESIEKAGTALDVVEEYEIVKCGTLTSSGSDTCTMKTGSGSKTVIQGDILAEGKIYQGGSVVISVNQIEYVGCTPEIGDSTIITCADAVVSPGFINAHDHITYSNGKPDDWGAERFDHRNDWRKALNGHSNHNGKSTQNNEVGELRMLLGGTTSVFGSGNVVGLIRNVDKAKVGNNPNGYPGYQTFPLSDSGGTKCSNSTKACGCSSFTIDSAAGGSHYYGPHIAEGINDYAVNELRCLAGEGSGSKNILNSKLGIIHGVGATPDLIKKIADADSKLIWSPRSNVSLYGDTARVTVYDNAGVTIALGTDWIYSGSANMLRELECADFLNSYYYNHQFSDYDLWKMATINSALALGLDPVLGSLEVGKIADIVVFAKNGRNAHRAVIGADNGDVALVMLDGQIAFGDANIMASGAYVTMCGVEKRVDTTVTGTSKSYKAIADSAAYDLFFCNGTAPKNEPTCVPMRTRAKDTTSQNTTLYDGEYSDANDRDGDGIPDSVDNCPDVFNPVRPEDRDASSALGQADYDGDGYGDVCDKAPLDKDKH